MKVAYCEACKLVVAAGPLPETIRVRGKAVVYPYRHVADGQTHVARLVVVPDTPQRPGEEPGVYLARLAEAHKALLV